MVRDDRRDVECFEAVSAAAAESTIRHDWTRNEIRDLFALLAEARARITANIQALDARRDFWLASVDLQAAIIGGRGGGEVAEMPSTTVAIGGGGSGGH